MMKGIISGADLPLRLSLNKLGQELEALSPSAKIGFRAEYDKSRKLVAIVYEVAEGSHGVSKEALVDTIRGHTCADDETEEAIAAAVEANSIENRVAALEARLTMLEGAK